MAGFSQNALAVLTSCSVGTVNNGSFDTSIQDVFIAPVEFDVLEVGEPVSVPRYFTIDMICTVAGQTFFGFGSLPVPEVYAVAGQAEMFTTPQLASIGLGYKVLWDSFPHWGGRFFHGRQALTSVTEMKAPLLWFGHILNETNITRSTIHGYVQFYKIGPIQSTGGVPVPASITTNLVNFYVTHKDDPTQVFASHLYTWSTSTFVSKVRACTPLVDHTVNFGTMTHATAPAPGTVLSHGDFSLTFTCPYLAYTQIGYSFVPKYTPNISPTVMALEPGAGRAKGVGIRIQRCNGGLCDQTITLNDTYYLSEFNLPVTEYTPSIPYATVPDYQNTPGDGPDGALNATRSRTIDFRAELVRAGPEPFAPGSVKSVVWIYIKYK